MSIAHDRQHLYVSLECLLVHRQTCMSWTGYAMMEPISVTPSHVEESCRDDEQSLFPELPPSNQGAQCEEHRHRTVSGGV